MRIKIGTKIRELRKEKNISQEVLAQYLNVSFQAVSKWEQEITLPDLELVPAIAAFFDVSTDELLQCNRLETDKKVERICNTAYRYRMDAPERAEEILREGLRQFPGNEILLNNLLYVIRGPERSSEVISLCTTLVRSAKQEDVRLDALRILAQTYWETGRQELVLPTLEQIPEIYFTKLELCAQLLEGNAALDAAEQQIIVSLEHLLTMLRRVKELTQESDPQRAARCEDAARTVAHAMEGYDPKLFCAAFFSDAVRQLAGRQES